MSEPAQDRPAGDPHGNNARNLATLERMAAAFNAQDVDAIIAEYDPEGIFDTSQGPHPWGERFTGHAEIRAAVAGVFRTLPDVHFENHARWVCGDRGVTEWTCTATTPKGHPMEVRGCDLFEFRAGKVIRKDTYFKQVVRPKT